MHSFIVEGGGVESRASHIQDLLSAPTELIHLVAEKSSLTIKQVQSLTGPLSISARLPRVVWIEEANLLTLPAQNALLKMLEEPPPATRFYLTCNSAAALLPTIRSRCQTIALNSPNTANSSNTANVLTDLKQIMALSPGDRLSAIVKRDRGESLAWIGTIEAALRDRLKSPALTPKNAVMIAQIALLAQNLHLQLESNCSLTLATQNFYLLLPHTRSTT